MLPPTRCLREDERIRIADRLREKASVRTIAAELGPQPSRISREIRRNGMPLRGDHTDGSTAPTPLSAGPMPAGPGPGKIGQDTELRNIVQAHLTMR